MEKRPFSIFSLTEEQAIELLLTPPEQLEEPSDRYIAASQLVNYPSERSINALMTAIQSPVVDLNTRIVRRKAVETLGYIKAAIALPMLQFCLQDEDRYTVENAIWSIGEIGGQDGTCLDDALLDDISSFLAVPEQNHRLILQVLTKLNYRNALPRIEPLAEAEDPSIQGAAIVAICQLTGDVKRMSSVVDLLQHASVNARRSSIQDLMDAHYTPALSSIVKCPVSMVFRLRGVRSLTETALLSGAMTFDEIEPYVEQVIRDHPRDLDLVHEYDQPPPLDFAIHELYETDFGRCYLAAQTLLETYADVAPVALTTEYTAKAKGDYGAHYHVIKLLGWLNDASAYSLLVEALNNPAPQFQKSRTAAAIALGELGDGRAISVLREHVTSPIWPLNYACVMALAQLGDVEGALLGRDAEDAFVQAKTQQLMARSNGSTK